MDELISITAITKVTLGGRIHPPGARLDAPPAIATELMACGAARRGDETPTDPPDRGQPDPTGALERVSGIGPITARELRVAGVADLTALAALTDEALARLDLDETTRKRIRADWRAQAAALVRGAG